MSVLIVSSISLSPVYISGKRSSKHFNIVDSYKNGKIYYNILLDDRAGLFEAYSILIDVVSYIEKDKGLIK